ncbi:MAG: amidohydrolase family protein, partial [Gillisia sp.]
MRIDSHVHFWKYQPETYSWIDDSMKLIQKDFLPEDFETVMNSNEIDGCILVQAVQSEAETEFLLKLSAENNLVKGVVGWVDFSSEKVEEKLEKYSKNKIFKGVRHTVYDERGEFLENPEFHNGISLLEKFGLTYDILVFDFQLAAAINLVEKFPYQKFILDHIGKPQVS